MSLSVILDGALGSVHVGRVVPPVTGSGSTGSSVSSGSPGSTGFSAKRIDRAT